MPTPADELKTAATTLRKLAFAAGGEAWTADHHDRGTIVHPTDSTHSLFMLAADGMRAAGTPCVIRPVGAYMAAVGPNVGEMFAALLEQAVRALDEGRIAIPAEALAVARAVNAATHTP